MKLLIDADSVIYTACSAVERAIQWDEDLWSFSADEKEARERVVSTVQGLLSTMGADSVMMALTGEGTNWRTLVLPTYKRARGKTRKPVCYQAVKRWVEETYPFRKYANLEGDDVLGILATTPALAGNCVVVSIDKDLKTIPGMHFNPDKDQEVRVISNEEADYWHLYQTLMGDRVDGYDGCPGIGAVGAEKILKKSCSWKAVVSAYQSKGLNEASALTQARVARILRHGEYTIKTGEVHLWTPEN